MEPSRLPPFLEMITIPTWRNSSPCCPQLATRRRPHPTLPSQRTCGCRTGSRKNLSHRATASSEKTVPTVLSLPGSFLSPKISFFESFYAFVSSLVSVLSFLGFLSPSSLILRIPHVFPNLFSELSHFDNPPRHTHLLSSPSGFPDISLSPSLGPHLHLSPPLFLSWIVSFGFLVCRRGSIPRRTQPFH